jgi:hypothetical protein
MKAVVLREHGGLDNLQYVTDFPDPVATAGHVVIRVGATSFNYHDVFTVRGMPGIKVPMPMIIGLDMAGEILETGPGVEGWKPGDRVLVNPLNRHKGLMGEMMHGGLAEKCLVAEHQLIRMPDRVTFAEAASLPVAYGTAHRMIVTHDIEHDIRTDRVRLLPAVGHTTGIITIGINEHDELPVHAQEAGIVSILVAHIGQVTFQLIYGRVALAFCLMIDRPAEIRSGSSLEQPGDTPIGSGALSPPGGNTGLDAAVLHRGNVLPSHGLAGIVKAQRGVVVRKRVESLLVPCFREPRIVERSPDRERRL